MKKVLGVGCLVIVVLFLFVGCAGVMLVGSSVDSENSEGNTTNEGDTEEVANEEEEVEEETLLQVGESATIDGITVTVNSVGYTDERNQFHETPVDSVLVVDVTYENNSGEDITVGGDFDLYADGEKMDTYPISDILMGGLSDGRTITGVEGYGVVGSPESLELEFEPMWSFSGEKAIFDVSNQ